MASVGPSGQGIERRGYAVIRGEGTAVVKGVTPDEVFDFVLDPAQYTKADTKIVWVTKLADLPEGMLAREDGKFLGLFKGSVVTRYRWTRPTSIDVTLEHGVPRALHAWFEIDGRRRGHPGAPRRGARPRPRPPRPAPRRRGALVVRALGGPRGVPRSPGLLESGERGRGPDHAVTRRLGRAGVAAGVRGRVRAR